MKKKRGFSIKRNLLPALLAAAMVFTNVSGDLSAVWAAQTETVEFEIQGSDLVDSVREAIENSLPVTEDDLDFTDGAVDKFESIFLDTGKVYEVYPSLDGGTPDGDVRFFVRLPEDADDTYELTGDEEVIFLYINNGEETLRFTTNVLRNVGGEQKVKRTGKVSVKAYDEAFGEADHKESSRTAAQAKAQEPTTAGEDQNKDLTKQETGDAQETGAETLESHGSQNGDETAAEEQQEEGSETADEEQQEADEETAEEEQQEEGSETEAEDQSETDDETEAESQEEADSETEAEDQSEADDETEGEDRAEADSGHETEEQAETDGETEEEEQIKVGDETTAEEETGADDEIEEDQTDESKEEVSDIAEET